MSSGAGPANSALVAIDLGAESCRVSLLRWRGDEPRIAMVRRFANAPQDHGAAGWHWNLDRICGELEAGLRSCAELAPEGVASVGNHNAIRPSIGGWARITGHNTIIVDDRDPLAGGFQLT